MTQKEAQQLKAVCVKIADLARGLRREVQTQPSRVVTDALFVLSAVGMMAAQGEPDPLRRLAGVVSDMSGDKEAPPLTEAEVSERERELDEQWAKAAEQTAEERRLARNAASLAYYYRKKAERQAAKQSQTEGGEVMDAIWKYPLEITDRQTVQVPKGARPLSVGLDGDGQLCVWIRVKPNHERGPQEDVAFNIFGTGDPIIGHPGRFLGTVTAPNGLVWHIFEGD
jgi:hypothetical protein